MPPIGENRSRILLTPSGTAAIIDSQYRVTISREHLSFNAEGMLILSVRPTMNAQEQRNFRSLNVTSRIGQQAMHFGTVLTFETDFFRLRDLQFIHQRVVQMSNLAKLLAFHRIDFRWLGVIAGKQDRMAGGDRQTRNDNG